MEDKKILVVEDNPDLRHGIGLRLRGNGYRVAFAEDAISATAAIVKQKPDLVLLDLGLPGGDGFLVMERLRNLDGPDSVPVIVMTGRESAVNRDRALRAGAIAFFQKPVEDNKLLLAIWQAIGKNAGRETEGGPD